MDTLPLDVWQLIVSLNDSLEDVRAIELTCKFFRQLSLNRTSLTFYEQPWKLLARFTNLRIAKGLISRCCEAVFDSKLTEFMISTDVDVVYRNIVDDKEDKAAYKVANERIIDWLAKYPKKRVRVYSNIIESNMTRNQLYLWTPTSLIIDQWDARSFLSFIVTTYRSKCKGDVMLYLPKSFMVIGERIERTLKELQIKRLLIGPELGNVELFNRSFEFVEPDLESITVVQYDVSKPHGVVAPCPIHVERYNPLEPFSHKLTKKREQRFLEMYYGDSVGPV